MKVSIYEKHELTLSFTSSLELCLFAEEHKDKIVSVTDYNYQTWEDEDGND